MTSEGMGEMFEDDFANMSTKKYPLMLMGSLVGGLSCADLGARTPIGVSGISKYLSQISRYLVL